MKIKKILIREVSKETEMRAAVAKNWTQDLSCQLAGGREREKERRNRKRRWSHWVSYTLISRSLQISLVPRPHPLTRRNSLVN